VGRGVCTPGYPLRSGVLSRVDWLGVRWRAGESIGSTHPIRFGEFDTRALRAWHGIGPERVRARVCLFAFPSLSPITYIRRGSSGMASGANRR
jgi:hypothetical protein